MVVAQTLTTLHSFCSESGCLDGTLPLAGLVQGTDGNLFGTTAYGGTKSSTGGTVFKMTPGGALTTIYSFCAQAACLDGSYPSAGMLPDVNGDLYSTAFLGGAYQGGTLFKVTPSGALTTPYNFCAQTNCLDGAGLEATLIRGTDGFLYGTTSGGGGVANAHDKGTIFVITPSGTLTTLYRFCAQPNCVDGSTPTAGLVQAINGDLYGTTYYGGAHNYGTVFKITLGGALTTLYNFCSRSGCSDGEFPQGGLTLGNDGFLYGTTTSTTAGGIDGDGGTVFVITPGGTLTTLYRFCTQPGCKDGSSPTASLIQGSDGNLYGMTLVGAYGGGTIFKITPGGALTTLYNFCTLSECADGDTPVGSLVQDTNGMFYGVTTDGGANSSGTVFSLSTGLKPFVGLLPGSGREGETIEILGTHLTGATSVTFSGTPAAFEVISDSLITATVPTGAFSGKVQVVTPGGTLVSSMRFLDQSF